MNGRTAPVTSSQFVHAEAELVAQLGVPAEKIRAVRLAQLGARGGAWELVGGLVRLTNDGRARLLSALSVPAAPDSATNTPQAPAAPIEAEKNRADYEAFWQGAVPPTPAGALAIGAERELTCVKTVRNRRMIEARTEDGAVAWVRVKDNHNFRPGMKLPARFLGNGQWELARRCPRHPGKW